MKGPDYTVSDLAFYGGLMGGFILTFLGIQAAFPDWPHIARLGVAAVVGLVIGFVTLKLYEAILKPPTNRDDQNDRPFGR